MQLHSQQLVAIATAVPLKTYAYTLILILGLLIALSMGKFYWKRAKIAAQLRIDREWAEENAKLFSPSLPTGDVTFEDDGRCYVTAVVEGTPLKILVDPTPRFQDHLVKEMMRSSLAPAPRVEKEMACAGSSSFPTQCPKGHIILHNSEAKSSDLNHGTWGTAFRLRIDGKTLLVTATHVIKGLVQSNKGLDRSAYMRYPKGDGFADLRMDPKWPIYGISKESELDVTMIEVPDGVWSSTGVAALKTSRPHTSDTLTVNTVDSQGKWTVACGRIKKILGPYQVSHSANTEFGASGTPLLVSGCVVGVHTGRNNVTRLNHATTLGFLRPVRKESSDLSKQELFTRNVPSRADADYEDMDNRVTWSQRDRKLQMFYEDQGVYTREEKRQQKAFEEQVYSAQDADAGMAWGDYYEDEEDADDDYDDYPEDRESSKPTKLTPRLGGKTVVGFEIPETKTPEPKAPRVQVCAEQRKSIPKPKKKRNRKRNKRPESGSEELEQAHRVLAQHLELANLEWEEPQAVENSHGNLLSVGKTSLVFRAPSKQTRSAAVGAALFSVPEMTNWHPPDQSNGAIIKSLAVQASRRFAGVVPSKDERESGMIKTIPHYPQTQVPPAFAGEEIDLPELRQFLDFIIDESLNMKAGPGNPLAALLPANRALLLSHRERVIATVIARIQVMANSPLPTTSKEALDRGLSDVVRTFVKNEPHSTKKVREGRMRLIASVSLVDSLVERLLCYTQNKAEIANYTKCASQAGLGLQDEDALLAFQKRVIASSNRGKIAEADISGWDWSVQPWELRDDAEMRRRLMGAQTGSLVHRLLLMRTECLILAVLQDSGGRLYELKHQGIQLSGSFNTSSTNSRVRVYVSNLIGAEWCYAMGDDTAEDPVEGAAEKYTSLGHRVKLYQIKKRDFEFCSTDFRFSTFYPVDPTKTFYNYMSHPFRTMELKYQFEQELRGHPRTDEFLALAAKIDAVLSPL